MQIITILAAAFISQSIGVLCFGKTAFTTTRTVRCLSTLKHHSHVLVAWNRQRQCLDYVRSSLKMNENYENASVDRRGLISRALPIPAILSFLVPRLSHAVDQEHEMSKKPFAPLENLIPALRVKLTIDKAISLTRSLISVSPGSKSSIEILNELENILLQPQNYVRSLKLQGVPTKPAELYLDSYKPMNGDLPFQRFLIRNGDVSSWKQLKKNEKEQERSSEVRAALNAYTDVLSFSGDSYLLNVDRAARSSMIREDRLPALKQVITSDMGMRYLYRNQVLTTMDDVKAELEYQLSNPDGRIDGTELLNLLVLAEMALGRWLSLIDPNDVKAAIEVVQQN